MPARYLPSCLVALVCLACSHQDNDPTPPDYSHAADFTYAGTLQSGSPLTFSSTPGDVRAYRWDFGDGTPPSTMPQPVHTFAKGGVFPVELRVATPGGLVTSTQKLTVAQTDTLASYFAAVVGDYRLTRQYFYTTSPGPGSGNGFTACDIVVTVRRDRDYLAVEQGGSAFIARTMLSPPKSTPGYYRFSGSSGAHYSYDLADFKLGADSIVVYSELNGGTGGNKRKWWGKRR